MSCCVVTLKAHDPRRYVNDVQMIIFALFQMFILHVEVLFHGDFFFFFYKYTGPV